MWAVRPSRNSTSASQWRGAGSVCSASTSVTAAIYPPPPPVGGRVAERGPRPRWSSSRARNERGVSRPPQPHEVSIRPLAGARGLLDHLQRFGGRVAERGTSEAYRDPPAEPGLDTPPRWR